MPVTCEKAQNFGKLLLRGSPRDKCNRKVDAAETMALYNVRSMTEEIVRLTDLCVKSCERLK